MPGIHRSVVDDQSTRPPISFRALKACRSEYDELVRRVRDLEDRADAHSIVVAVAIQRGTDSVDRLTASVVRTPR